MTLRDELIAALDPWKVIEMDGERGIATRSAEDLADAVLEVLAKTASAYQQMRLVSRQDDGTTKVHHGTRSVSARERPHIVSGWIHLMAQYPNLHLAIEERTCTQTFTEWDTAVNKPKSTLF